MNKYERVVSVICSPVVNCAEKLRFRGVLNDLLMGKGFVLPPISGLFCELLHDLL